MDITRLTKHNVVFGKHLLPRLRLFSLLSTGDLTRLYYFTSKNNKTLFKIIKLEGVISIKLQYFTFSMRSLDLDLLCNNVKNACIHTYYPRMLFYLHYLLVRSLSHFLLPPMYTRTQIYLYKTIEINSYRYCAKHSSYWDCRQLNCKSSCCWKDN